MYIQIRLRGCKTHTITNASKYKPLRFFLKKTKLIITLVVKALSFLWLQTNGKPASPWIYKSLTVWLLEDLICWVQDKTTLVVTCIKKLSGVNAFDKALFMHSPYFYYSWIKFLTFDYRRSIGLRRGYLVAALDRPTITKCVYS